MICPKCNRKYEDDMPRCLWCDALNPNYGMDGPLPDNQKDVEKREIFDESFEDGSIFKLENDKHVVNVLAILYMASLMILGVVAWCMIEDKGVLWILFVLMELFFTFFVYLFSKKVLKVKWFKDKFVLVTRYGEKEFLLGKQALFKSEITNFGNHYLIFKKGWQTFRLEECDFPKVVKKIIEIHSELTEMKKKCDGNGGEQVIYNSVTSSGGMPLILVEFFCSLILLFLCFWEIPGKAGYSTTICFLISFFGFSRAYSHSLAVLEIKWLKDKFILCTLYGEKIFLFDKTTPYKVEKSKNGIVRLVFKKGFQSFVVNELDFPKAVKKMKMLFNVDK